MAAEPVTAKQATDIIHMVDCYQREKAFVESLRLEGEQITGTRYKVIINERPTKER